jgi:hypothetical protein
MFTGKRSFYKNVHLQHHRNFENYDIFTHFSALQKQRLTSSSMRKTFFLFVIVLSVPLLFSDHPFGVFKLFLHHEE